MSKLKELVQTYAPAIGTALGGPGAGLAIKFIAEKVLGKPDAKENEIEAALAEANPEVLCRLKELDNTFKAEIEKQETERFRLETIDVQSARDMGIKTKGMLINQTILAYINVIAFFSFSFYLIVNWRELADMPDWIRTFILVSFGGSIVVTYQTIHGFFYGSSYGSAMKDKNRKN